MRLFRSFLIAALGLGSGPAWGQGTMPPGPDNLVLSCTGAFAPDTNKERVIATFGADHVRDEEILALDASIVTATILFPDDPTRRLEIAWHDQARRARPHFIRAFGDIDRWESLWRGPNGLRIGTPIAEVERQNGRPFFLYGYQGDFGGLVADWRNGALHKIFTSCEFTPSFRFTSTDPPDQISQSVVFLSNHPLVRRSTFHLNSLTLLYYDTPRNSQ